MGKDLRVRASERLPCFIAEMSLKYVSSVQNCTDQSQQLYKTFNYT